MGTKMATSHANNFMEYFKNTHVYTYPTQPHTWLRFIDDIFVIWTEGRQSLDAFIQHLNSCHHTIKFTADISNSCVNFLDTTVNLTNNGTLDVDLYSKPTDLQNYLLCLSAHPQSCNNSLPYCQFLWIRRICTNIDNVDKHTIEIAKHFTRRGYPTKMLEEALILACRKDRDSLLNQVKPHTTSQDQKLYLISTYQPNWGGLKDLVTRNWDFLTRTKFLHKKKVIFGYRCNKNLKETFLCMRRSNTHQNLRKHTIDPLPT